VFHRLPRLAIVAALACSLGLHWGFFQSVAWMGMVISYSQDAPFKEALAKTFDGKHPCPLCKVVAEGKKSEKKSEATLSLKKFEGLNQVLAIVISPPASFPAIEAQEVFPEALAHAPPIPPPRTA
jgi:hypothetical protein